MYLDVAFSVVQVPSPPTKLISVFCFLEERDICRSSLKELVHCLIPPNATVGIHPLMTTVMHFQFVHKTISVVAIAEERCVHLNVYIKNNNDLNNACWCCESQGSGADANVKKKISHI